MNEVRKYFRELFASKKLRSAKDNNDLNNIIENSYPLELILNFIEVNRAFHDAVYFVITKKVVKLSSNHLTILLGTWKLHISEAFFLKLCSFPNFFASDDIRVLRDRSTCYRLRDESSLMRICIEYKFKEGLISLFNHGCRVVYPERIFLNFKKDFPFDIFLFLIENDLCFFQFSNETVMKLLRNDKWDHLIHLVSAKNNFYAKDVYSTYFENINEEIGTIDRWVELSEAMQFSYYKVEKVNSSIPKMSWKLAEYFLSENNGKGINHYFRNSHYEFSMTKEMSSYEPLIDFIVLFEDSSSRLSRLNFYRPRILLEYYCVRRVDCTKARSVLKEYDPKKDIHSEVLQFPFFEIENTELLKDLVKKVPFQYIQYIESLVHPKHELFSQIVIETKKSLVNTSQNIYSHEEFIDIHASVTENLLSMKKHKMAKEILQLPSPQYLGWAGFCLLAKKRLVDLLCLSIRIEAGEVEEYIKSQIFDPSKSRNPPVYLFRSFFDEISKIIIDDNLGKHHLVRKFEQYLELCLDSFPNDIFSSSRLQDQERIPRLFFRKCVELNLFKLIKKLLDLKSWRNELIIPLFFVDFNTNIISSSSHEVQDQKNNLYSSSRYTQSMERIRKFLASEEHNLSLNKFEMKCPNHSICQNFMDLFDEKTYRIEMLNVDFNEDQIIIDHPSQEESGKITCIKCSSGSKKDRVLNLVEEE